MKYTIACAVLVAGVLAGGKSYDTPPSEPTLNPSPSPIPSPNYSFFTVISSRSASPVHLLPLNARGGKFYLGGDRPSHYCPIINGTGCPSSTSTVLVDGDKTLSLGVITPGGQKVYIAPDGAMSYTMALSAYIPEGSIVDQFNRTFPSNNNGFGYLRFNSGFIACPVDGDGLGYQVFGLVPGLKARSGCYGFNAITSKFLSLSYAWRRNLLLSSINRPARCMAVLEALGLYAIVS